MIAAVLIIKSLGVLVAWYFLRRGYHEIKDTHHHHVSTSHAVSPLALLLWRVLMFAFTAGVLAVQVYERSTRAFRFFTVWNWTAIIIYFFLASISSAMTVWGVGTGYGLRAQRSRGTRGTRTTTRTRTRTRTRAKTRSTTEATKAIASTKNNNQAASSSTLLSKTVATMFHVLTPMTLYIDIITWGVLVPALMKTPDLERRKHWETVMFSFISYSQHGLNALIMGVEMLINNIPNSDNWAHGVVCMWNILFALWALFFFSMTGQALYPFLDYSKASSELWVAFVALLGTSMGSSWIVQKLLGYKWKRFV